MEVRHVISDDKNAPNPGTTILLVKYEDII
jgi:hypothetical protein